eukprot:3237656-Pleurochrysis_carterae.AAC.1
MSTFGHTGTDMTPEEALYLAKCKQRFNRTLYNSTTLRSSIGCTSDNGPDDTGVRHLRKP